MTIEQPLLVLTIHQPFATWIMRGTKPIENRTWKTNHIGRIAIHAGLNERELRLLFPGRNPYPPEYPLGVVLGDVRLACVIHIDQLKGMRDRDRGSRIFGVSRTVGELLENSLTTGPYCWILEDPRPYDPPVPLRGQRGLFGWEGP